MRGKKKERRVRRNLKKNTHRENKKNKVSSHVWIDGLTTVEVLFKLNSQKLFYADGSTVEFFSFVEIQKKIQCNHGDVV